ncbi:hypothetical protein AGDE_03050 [Angomonas deanei]|nr:hypothetical protein AGDE_03050 [Angomonas deanei]|eukprot:EPY40876.1 hypothetical protein AGDE_03050 [Angomonas deanei]
MSRAPVATTRGSSGPPVLLPLTVFAVGALCAWKISKTCSLSVHPKCVTVVYDTRRKAVLRTSADDELRKDDLPRVEHFSALFYMSKLLIYCSRSLVVVPPSSFFGVFTLPRSVFSEPGEAVDCVVENVAVPDGTVDMVLTLYYCIPFDSLERYLAAVGPQPRMN